MMDVPNARSLHVAPTPRGGGLAIVIVVLALEALLLASGLLSTDLEWATLGMGRMDRDLVPGFDRVTG